jgi:hypothetical protein
MITGSITGFNGDTSFIPLAAPEVIEVKVEKKITVEEYVKNYFSDIPVLIEVAKCESRFRQHDEKGEVLRGEKNSLDRGVMQINEYFHNENSEKLGFDILTLEGNTAYARYLFEKYGVKPWKSSGKCWGKTTSYNEFIELAVNRN